MLRNIFITTILLCTAGYITEASAIPRIVGHPEEGVEANKIVITLNSDQRTGTVSVEGCRLCPLQLEIDEKTKFFFKNKPVKRGSAVIHSGNEGAIFFTKEHANKIRW